MNTGVEKIDDTARKKITSWSWTTVFVFLAIFVLVLVVLFIFYRKKTRDSFEIDGKHVTWEKDKLGEGSFGDVFKGRISNQAVAIKRLKGEHSSIVKEFHSECGIMKTMNHENVIGLVGCCQRRDELLIVTEFATKGSLISWLHNCRASRKVDVKELVGIGKQVASGMAYLQQKNYCHRDLAARNVLLTDGSNGVMAKIADLGLARDLANKEYYRMTGDKFPWAWTAVEVFSEGVYTLFSDRWSYGVLLWEMFTLGRTPYDTWRIPFNGVITWLQAGKRLPRPEYCSNEMYPVMLECWNADPPSRPTFQYLGNRLEAIMGSI